MSTTPVFESKLEPMDPKSSIVALFVRVDDPVNITDTDTLIDFLHRQFPYYNVVHVIAGHKQVIDHRQDSTA